MPRFTPAYAGNILGGRLPAWAKEVHPRVCGEYYRRLVLKPLTPGSPPRMRGIPHATQRVVMVTGFTPAYAGNTVDRILKSTPS